MKSRKTIAGVIVFILLALIVATNRDRIRFNWASFWQQLSHVRLAPVVLGVALIYSTYWLRALRWSVFLSPGTKVSPGKLVGSQFIGFTAVALFGRLADLTRPYLIAQRVRLPLSSQLAVYTIERMFDLGAAAILFSGALVFAPRDLPHHEIFVRTGAISLAGTAFLALFAIVVRAYGPAVAHATQSILSRLSKPLAETVADKILGFRDGLNAIASAQEFLLIALISLAMWTLIGFAYVETLHAFATTPELANVNFGRAMLLMGASIGGSLLQLPILGWFTQIAVTATAMHTFYGAPIEAATACGAVLLAVTFLSIIPAGLLFARLDRISLKSVATESSADVRAVDPIVVPQPTTLFAAGDRIKVSDHFFWAKGATGTISSPPGAVTGISGKWDGDLTRQESSSLGKHTVYWVWFDEPQHDADGEGPFRGGSIWESALTHISEPN